jgi:hypothetical protein
MNMCGTLMPEGLAATIISTWILERMRMTVEKRTGKIVFDLGDTKLRGAFAALLPKLGKALAHLPADRPFWELDKDQVLDVFVAGFQAAREAGVGVFEMEADDEIPF